MLIVCFPPNGAWFKCTAEGRYYPLFFPKGGPGVPYARGDKEGSIEAAPYRLENSNSSDHGCH